MVLIKNKIKFLLWLRWIGFSLYRKVSSIQSRIYQGYTKVGDKGWKLLRGQDCFNCRSSIASSKLRCFKGHFYCTDCGQDGWMKCPVCKKKGLL